MENLIITYIKTNGQTLEMWTAIDTEKNLSVGHIFMNVEKDNRIKFLDAWVHDDYRRRGIYRKLWETRWEFVLDNYKGYTVYAWCKDTSLPLLLEKEFTPGEIVTYVEKKI
jgi:GNAT superfamily N-acetyltransferase